MSTKVFDSIKLKAPKRNAFDRSHERKLSMNMGELVPILVEEVVPGDKFKVSSEIFMRLAPMVAPIMHRVNVYTHFFYVPNRLVFNEWEEFITGGADGTLTPVFPTLPMNTANKDLFGQGSLADYFGLPPVPPTGAPGQGANVNALPFRAYQMIYNNYYRDQNLTAEVGFSLGNDAATDVVALSQLRQRAWEKDYFTSCLPWSQRGADVLLPIDAQIDFTGKYKDVNAWQAGPLPAVDGALMVASGAVQDQAGNPVELENIASPVDATSSTVTINELRKAARLQEWLEKSARAGSRYIEHLLAFWGVRSSDARLQRPEYLGGGKQKVVISEVLQTSQSQDETQPLGESPQGNMAGHGFSMGKSNKFSKSFEEHGFIIGIMSTLPRTAYSQGIERMWSKNDKFEYFWPEFAHLGEQKVEKREIYQDWTNTEGNGADTFGYQSRYAEYKYKQSSIHGDFRDPLSLEVWHMGRRFDAMPDLNTSFVESDPTHRIFASTDETIDKLYVQIYNDVRAIRPMPVFNQPTL